MTIPGEKVRSALRWLSGRPSKRPPIEGMTDLELGRLTRMAMKVISDKTDATGLKKVMHVSAALCLVDIASRQNAARMTVNLGGTHVGEKDTGDWVVTVLRPGEPEIDPECDSAPVTLEGWLRPGMAGQAIDAFERLTVCRVASPDAREKGRIGT